jgi:hypothetical protein
MLQDSEEVRILFLNRAMAWVAAGVKLIREIGAEKYLHMVLSNLRQTFEIKIRP